MLDSLAAWALAHPGLAIGSGGVVAFGLYAIYAYWDVIKTKLPGGSTTVKTTKPGIPTRRQALDYLDALYIYFEDEGCKEGMGAIKLAVTHAFHEHQPADATTGEAVNRIVNAIGDALKPSTVAPAAATVNTAPESR